jgi:diaminohydroxyphosphoribosylaminopyrimidine deaminase/5-amino-6-(5-phosphoribosylamino)uracil reductase
MRAEQDRRLMAAALRLSRWRLGQTGMNPSVGALIVRDDGAGPVVVGHGVTAPGGRPHAETQALAQAGPLARGATAYVTLEPCAHHGQTPPCADALVASGIRRVVVAADDPDPRVSGRGYAILQAAGIEVTRGVLATEAERELAGFLTRIVKHRPYVTLKLALSPDGMIGRLGQGQVLVTGPGARAQSQMMRVQSDAILVGLGTAIADDPLLTVRLAGLERHSPVRVVLDRDLSLPLASKLARTGRDVPLLVATAAEPEQARRSLLAGAGADFLSAPAPGGRLDLEDVLGQLAGRGLSSLIVEGGAATAQRFLNAGLVDRLVLFRGTSEIGAGGVASPVGWDAVGPPFRLVREDVFGGDQCREWVRDG